MLFHEAFDGLPTAIKVTTDYIQKKREFYNRCCRTFLPLVGTTTIKRHFGNKQPLRCSLRCAPRHAALSPETIGVGSGNTRYAVRHSARASPTSRLFIFNGWSGRRAAKRYILFINKLYSHEKNTHYYSSYYCSCGWMNFVFIQRWC